MAERDTGMDTGSLLLQEYDAVVDRLTKFYRSQHRQMPRHEIDARAFDHDDYRQEFAIRALHASRAFQNKVGFCLPAERRFTYKSLWRHTKRLRRHQLVAERHPVIHGVAGPEIAESMEGKYEAAESLRLLQERLPAKDWTILMRVANAGSMLGAKEEGDGSPKTWRYTVERAQLRAAAILEKSVPMKRGRGVIGKRGERHEREVQERRLGC